MTVGEVCNRDVITVNAATAIVEAVTLMKTYHVGDLVVVEPARDGRCPLAY